MNKAEKLRLFWMGKKELTRLCVELWLLGVMTQYRIFTEFGVSSQTIRKTVREMRKL